MDYCQSHCYVVGKQRESNNFLPFRRNFWRFVQRPCTRRVQRAYANVYITGLAQFIAGIKGFEARDTLVTVINTMWGSFWIAIGILYAFVVSSILDPFDWLARY